MAKGKIGQSVKKLQKPLTLEERVFTLESVYTKLIQTVENSFGEVAKDLKESSENIIGMDRILRAMMECSVEGFSEKVTAKVKQNRINDLEAQAEQSSAKVKMLLAEGKLAVTDTIVDDQNIVVVTQRDENGDLKYPIRNHLALVQFVPAVKELLVGKKAGETVTIPTGTIEVLEVYKMVPQEEQKKEQETLPDATFAVNPENL